MRKRPTPRSFPNSPCSSCSPTLRASHRSSRPAARTTVREREGGRLGLGSLSSPPCTDWRCSTADCDTAAAARIALVCPSATSPPIVPRRRYPLKRMLINAIDPEESRIAVVEDGVLQELHVELASREAYLGNIYKGKVVNIEPSIGAAFVAFGGRVNGFLHVSDVLPAYGRPDFVLDDVIEGRARVDVDDGPESMQQALADDDDADDGDAAAGKAPAEPAADESSVTVEAVDDVEPVDPADAGDEGDGDADEGAPAENDDES